MAICRSTSYQMCISCDSLWRCGLSQQGEKKYVARVGRDERRGWEVGPAMGHGRRSLTGGSMVATYNDHVGRSQRGH